MILNADGHIRLELDRANAKLPPAVATARRIAEVAGFLNSDLIAHFPKGAGRGVVNGLRDGMKVRLAWRPHTEIGKMVFIIAMDGLPTNLVNIISFSDQQDDGQWKRFAEVVGNIILDNVVHGNTGAPAHLKSSSIHDDPDIDTKTLNQAMNALPPGVEKGMLN